MQDTEPSVHQFPHFGAIRRDPSLARAMKRHSRTAMENGHTTGPPVCERPGLHFAGLTMRIASPLPFTVEGFHYHRSYRTGSSVGRAQD